MTRQKTTNQMRTYNTLRGAEIDRRECLEANKKAKQQRENKISSNMDLLVVYEMTVSDIPTGEIREMKRQELLDRNIELRRAYIDDLNEGITSPLKQWVHDPQKKE
tara:strand:- start:3407 stop:3724 length:318 start_codon:yes stop_codon:yes gene_type:complete